MLYIRMFLLSVKTSEINRIKKKSIRYSFKYFVYNKLQKISLQKEKKSYNTSSIN